MCYFNFGKDPLKDELHCKVLSNQSMHSFRSMTPNPLNPRSLAVIPRILQGCSQCFLTGHNERWIC